MGLLRPIIEQAEIQVLSGADVEAADRLLDVLRDLGLQDGELAATKNIRAFAWRQPRMETRGRTRMGRRFKAARLQAMRQEATEETLRIARIVDHAIRVFGSETKAIRWLRKENGTLTNRRPIDLLKSETGAQAVEEALHRIDYGMYA